MPEIKGKVCLIVHDGWGVATEPGLEGNAIETGSTVNMDKIGADHRRQRVLAAHGTAVGLSEGLMGNSEVGHLNIGAGRVVWQDIVRIDVSIKKREFHKNKNILESFRHTKLGAYTSSDWWAGFIFHLLPFILQPIRKISDGGVHSYITHMYALLEAAKEQGVPHVYVGTLATIVGRYYAMDRDKRWERVKIAIDGLVGGVGAEAASAVEAIKKNYEVDMTDEFLKPIIVNTDGLIKDDDTLFFFNYRSDRMRELVSVVGLPDQPIEVAAMTNVLAEWLAAKGVKQAHIAETEKYAHVTFFFNGGVEAQFDLEERHIVPLPKVATYDLQPEMSVQAVPDTVARVVESKVHDFAPGYVLNADIHPQVGHTGSFDAVVRAIGATDAAVGTVYAACQRAGYVLLVTADHGNAEQMRNAATRAPHTAHTCNPVPFIFAAAALKADTEGADEEPGALCDVALDIMGLPQPEEMTGRSLFVRK
ncbi:cofactor-independent phosphoglycerate mutase [Mycena rosella]|uniref:phosphoglycerate mutase (2,3-diphosphoglycerate-independent) n=1 Tax=Mycena rosella TaxID=1033263 RepID=A0AAD7DLL9_MYCRO|nr:cofactor-independent phosphoglycerate mutase [Mycena rosella]